jgi:hypothetical protein
MTTDILQMLCEEEMNKIAINKYHVFMIIAICEDVSNKNCVHCN